MLGTNLTDPKAVPWFYSYIFCGKYRVIDNIQGDLTIKRAIACLAEKQDKIHFGIQFQCFVCF